MYYHTVGQIIVTFEYHRTVFQNQLSCLLSNTTIYLFSIHLKNLIIEQK